MRAPKIIRRFAAYSQLRKTEQAEYKAFTQMDYDKLMKYLLPTE